MNQNNIVILFTTKKDVLKIKIINKNRSSYPAKKDKWMVNKRNIFLKIKKEYTLKFKLIYK